LTFASKLMDVSSSRSICSAAGVELPPKLSPRRTKVKLGVAKHGAVDQTSPTAACWHSAHPVCASATVGNTPAINAAIAEIRAHPWFKLFMFIPPLR
jgi:hypothetical protein